VEHIMVSYSKERFFDLSAGIGLGWQTRQTQH